MTELIIEDRGAIRILTLNRPDKHNALDTGLTRSLHDALLATDATESVHVIVLNGAGKSFCAGADTSEFSTLVPENPDRVLARADLTASLHLAFSRISKPAISAVHGNALGGGAGLALACDLMVIAANARFGYPELKHGIVAAVVLANLVRQLGRKQAFELVSIAEPISGERALALGLANRCVPEDQVLSTALELGAKLAAWNPLALAATKRVFHRAADLALEPAMAVGRDANVIMRGFRKPKG